MSEDFIVPGSPSWSFIEMVIGEETDDNKNKFNVTTKVPRHLEQFSYTRTTQSGGDGAAQANTLLVTLRDETAIGVEYALANAFGTGENGFAKCTFKYGYAGGMSSPTYEGVISNYDIDFEGTSAVLSLQGYSTGLKGIGNADTKAYSGKKISDIVREVASAEGWVVGNIEETADVTESDLSTVKQFYQLNMSGAQFINRVLAPYARSAKSGQGNYQLYWDDSEGKVYFEPRKFGSFGEYLKSYEYKMGQPNSIIKSFNPDFSGIVTALNGGAMIEATSVDRITNEMFTLVRNDQTDAKRAVTGSRDIDRSNYLKKVGDSSYSYSELESLTATMWYSNSEQTYTASLITIGDPTLEPMVNIEVLVTNAEGIPHHSSGSYLVLSVVDDISGGTFESTANLIRNAMTIGVTESGGIDINIKQSEVPKTVASNGALADPTKEDALITSGATGSAKTLIDIAVAEEGYGEESGGVTKFGTWYGKNYGGGGGFAAAEWCQMFVAWCCNQANIPATTIPREAACTTFMNWFKTNGTFKARGSHPAPQPGDIVMFTEGSASISSHVGIVMSADFSKIYTIEGNSGEMVAKRSYNKTDDYILGYCIPKY